MMWPSKSATHRGLRGCIRILQPVSAAACIALFAAPFLTPTTGVAQSIDVSDASLSQLHQAASDAYRSGQRDHAMALTNAILARAPEDALALYLQAKLWFEARPTEATQRAARKTARHAFAAARSDVQHYETSVLAAQIAASQKRWFAANGWTRLSSLYAPNQQAKAQADQDLNTLQRLNPWQISGSFSIRPSSNVNGGAASSENRIEGYSSVGRLSTDAQALAGTEATASLSLRYRIHETAQSRTTIGGTFWTRQVDLRGSPTREIFDPQTQTSREVPIKNSNFSEDYLRADITYLRNLGHGRAAFSVNSSRYWQAGSDVWTGRGISARWAFMHDTVWVLDSSFEQRSYQRNRDDWLWSFGVERIDDLFKTGQLRTAIDWFEQDSPYANARLERLRGRIGFTPNQPLAGIILSGEATFQRSTYPEYSLLGMRPDGGRRDDRLSFRLAMHRPDWSIAGITPEWTIEASRTQSNVSRYTGHELAAGIGLRSNF